MKFTEKLSAHLTPEWRQQYICYADLKNMLLYAMDNAPIKTATNTRAVEHYFAQFEEDFMFECDKELRKVNTFYAEKLAETKRRFEVLNAALDEIIGEFHLRVYTESRMNLHQANARKSTVRQKRSKMRDLKNAFSELYLSLVLLQNYKVLNYTGFKKILKKHDKLLNNTKGKKWFEENVENAYFYKNNDLTRLMQDVENNFTEYLESGDRTQAMKRLRVPPLEEIQNIETVFRVGLFLGAFIVMLCLILIITSVDEYLAKTIPIHDLILFRAPFYIVMYTFLLGINVYNWRRFGVNHILIFEINPRRHLTYSHLLELHAIFGVIWCLCLLGYIYADFFNLSRLVFPLILFTIMFCFLLNPLPIFHRNARFWLWKLLGRIVAAPFFPVGFADFWFGDQLNSMVACLLDLKYLLCFYISNFNMKEDYDARKCLERDYMGNAIVRCLPSWFRFAQCLRRYHDTGQAYPFLVNAGKYASTFPMVIFLTLSAVYKENYEYIFQSPFFWLYLVMAIIQTSYCCCWDILVDFGLFRTFSNKNIFLREQIIYPSIFYYFVIVENILLRFAWAVSLYLVSDKFISSYNMDSITGCLEIIRRYIWNYIRLENEHLYNVGHFRAVRDIFISPIKTKNSLQIQKMMDEEDGVVNRASKHFKRDSIINDDDENENENENED